MPNPPSETSQSQRAAITADDWQLDPSAVAGIDAVRKILEVVCRTTGLGFSAVARVTETRWVACAVRDEIGFGLKAGEELDVATTLCHEIRQSGHAVVIDEVSKDAAYCGHPTPARYGFQSYVSVPITLPDGRFFGTLCAIDPKPAKVNTPETIGMFRLFADLIGLHLDAAERVKAETAARDVAAERLDRLRSVIASAKDYAVIGVDTDGRITDWSTGAADTFGYGEAAVVGELFDLIWTDEDRATGTPAKELKSAAEHGVAPDNRWHKRADGRRIYVVGATRPVRNAENELVGFVKVCRDETIRLEIDQRLTAVIQTSLDCIVGMDHTGRVIEWNPAAETTFGYARAEAIGQEMASLIIPPAYHDRHREGLRHYLATGEGPILGKRLELTACRKGGDEFPVEFSIVPVKGNGPPTFTGYLRDISDRKQAEAEREQLLASERAARAESERAGRMKDEFLATLSHEIRTPLNAILGWSQIMRTSGAPEDIAQGLEVIERNARAQSQIVEDLLDMSRIISGKVRLDVQRLDLSSIVQSAVETARPTADAKSVRLQSVIDPLRGVVVSGDASRLQQVLWNLLTNAVKFTPKGGRVQVLLERVNSHIEISVIDSGEGIAAEFLPYVFDRFRQADASTTRRHGGLGLGLSIVKQLVELHGGTVRVKSAGTGHGTTFTVALPLVVLHPEPEPDDQRRHPHALPTLTRVSDSCDEVKGLRVLVIDDEPDARGLVKRLLEDCRAVVTATGSVDEAVRLIATKQFDVLVSDIGMPGEDGYSLIKRVRMLGKNKGGDIPAIALTAYARAEDRVKAVSAGFQMHVAKPVEPVELVTMVAGAAGRTGPSQD